jgi:hypothetical protein
MSPSTHTAWGRRTPRAMCVSGVAAATGVAPVAATDAAGY